MDTMIEKRKQALQDLRMVENKIKALQVIEYGDYWGEYIKAFIDYTSIGLEDYIREPYGLECLEYEAQNEYSGLIEDLEYEGYNVRW